MPATAQQGPPPTNTISASSGTFSSGGVNEGGALGSQFGSSNIGAMVQSLTGTGGGGPLSSDQMQSLTARLGAMNLNPNDLASMGNALGLNSSQLSQVQQNIQASRQTAAPGMSPPPPFYPPQQSSAYPSQQLSAPNGFGAPTAPWAPPSVIETKFQQLDNPFVTVTPPTSSNLLQFGYSAFMSQVSTFAPTQNVPITDDYVLGPGDQLVVFTWGRVDAQLQLQVQSDGSVLIDQVGPLQVAGLTFGQARKLIEGRLKQSTGTEVNVTMGQLRSIQVTVVGEVNQPGTYTVSALSHVSNALLAAGGPAKTGSLRRVELRRGGQMVGTLDLYNVLLKGDNRGDVELKQGDVIRVPIVGRVVAVAGEVKRPAIFELEDRPEHLGEVVDQLAGGVTPFSYNGHLQVERNKNQEQVVVLDLPVQKMKQRDFEIKDGDLIKVFTVLPYHNNTVTLTGNVFRPGEYQWRKGMKVSDLIKAGQGVMPHTYFKYALLKRLEGSRRYTHFVQVDLAAAISGNSMANLHLQKQDELDVYSLDQLRDLPMVTVSGEVRLQGQYLLSERMRVSDLIYLAGGLKEDAYKPRAVLDRVSVAKGHALHHSIDLNLADILNSGTSNDDLVLKANDQLFISSVIDYNSPQRLVVASGEVISPGLYNFNQGMRIRDLIAMAGGFKDDADKQHVEVARTEVISEARTRRVFAKLDLRHGSPDLDYPLNFNDEVFVTVVSHWYLPWIVTVSGEVSKPGLYPVHDGERLSSLIARCGGFLADAYPTALVFTRTDVQKVEQQELDDARTRISQELLQFSMEAPMMASLSGSSGSSGSGAQTAMAGSFASLTSLLATTQGQQADGRVVLHWDEVMNGRSEDLALQDGDNIAVPRRPSSVNVLGMVFHPTSIVERSNLTVRDYVNAAGGVTPQGDSDRTMVIKADGSFVTNDALKDGQQASLFPLLPLISSDDIMSLRLAPGDTVYVPESLANLQTAVRMSYWKDITTIIANTASGLAVIGLLATNI